MLSGAVPFVNTSLTPRSDLGIWALGADILDLQGSQPQTPVMAHTYLVFNFGANEEKAQQAVHKLQGWKQAFRLDKKLQFKLERDGGEEAASPDPAPSSKRKSKGKEKSAEQKADKDAKSGNVKLLVRLYFSSHEKLSEQQWLARIPGDELFKDSSPQVINESAAEFSDTMDKFDSLE
jgi:hypothetical protein